MDPVMIAILCGLAAVAYGLLTSRQVLAASPGNARMQEIAKAIQEGAGAYLNKQYTAIGIVGVIVAVLVFVFLGTLPASERANEAHQVGFPFNQRILLGGWKLLFARGGWVIDGDLTPEETRGRYLVEGLGHCSECHTPRNALGGRQTARWLAGGPNPEGQGKIPNITPAHLEWSADEVAEYLKSGFTPDFDSVGGSMGDVVDNISHLPDSDRAAIAAYLAKVPPVE